MEKNINVNEELMDTTGFEEVEGGTALAVVSMEMLTNPRSNMYCTLKAESFDDKVLLYNAVSDPTEKMDKKLNVPFNLKDVVVHPVQLADDETGELVESMRTILIDDEGNSYAGVSMGVVQSLSRLFGIFGKPETWDKPIPVVLEKRDTKNGNKVTTLIVKNNKKGK